MSDLASALTQAAAEADWSAHNSALLKVVGKRGSLEEKRREISRARSRAVVAAVLETLADHYHDRAAQRAEADATNPQCDGDCGNDDCHMTSAVAAWQMAAAVATRTAVELRGEDT